MKIYTKTGDKGNTSLYDGERIGKDSQRVESYGTIDELNSTLGMARQFIEDELIKKRILRIQRELFDLAGELATRDNSKFPEKIKPQHIESLENHIDEYLDKMNRDEQFKFIIPGSNKASASLHVARTVCRRAERRMISLSRNEEVRPILIKYVNRLSDCLYTFGRYLESDLIYVDFIEDED